MRTLIVDDSKQDRALLKGLLKGQCECVEATDCKSALDALRGAFESNQAFDIVCLDIAMPDASGLELLRQIREIEKRHMDPHAKSMRVLMTTARADMKNILEAAHLGCDSYLTKPLSKERLFTEMEKFGMAIRWE